MVSFLNYSLKSSLPFQCSDKLGLSFELGSFAAGVMISTTDLAQHTLEQVRQPTTLLNMVTSYVTPLQTCVPLAVAVEVLTPTVASVVGFGRLFVCFFSILAHLIP